VTIHDYDTITLWAQQLDNTCVLLGKSGGLSAVYEVTEADPMPVHRSTFPRQQDVVSYVGGSEMILVKAVKIVTEHGTMYVPGTTPFTVLWH
jgi:hypothetical protein